MNRCYVLLLDEDEDDYQLMKSFIRDAFRGNVELDWYRRDGFADTMICSGYYLLTFIEYRLGNENGIEVIRKVKAKCPDQSILLLTSWDDEVVSDEEALKAGADQVLRKSQLSIELVKTILSKYLARSRCTEQLSQGTERASA